MISFKVSLVAFVSISFIWLSNSQTAFGPIFQSIRQIKSPAPQTGTFIFLHGFGGQTLWWMSLYRNVIPRYVKSIFPTAKSDVERNLFFMPLPSWYPTVLPIGLDNPEHESAILNAVERVHELIYSEMKKGIPSERIVVAGVAKGGALALVTGLTFPHRLAGIVAQSVYLPLSSYFRDRIFVKKLENKDTPILQIHGLFDPVLPVYIGLQTSSIIKRFNRHHRLLLTPSGHQPNLQALMETMDFLKMVIPP